MQSFSKCIKDYSTTFTADQTNFFKFFDHEYQFRSFISINREKHQNTAKKPTEFVLSVFPEPNNRYRILFKEGDDLRKDFFIYQSLELIKKVRLKMPSQRRF